MYIPPHTTFILFYFNFIFYTPIEKSEGDNQIHGILLSSLL